MQKEYKLRIIGNEARDKIKKGVDYVGDTLGLTLGPKGRNGLVERRGLGETGRTPAVINDGVFIARRLIHKDETIDPAVQVMIDGCTKTNDMVGDGTTTTAVLAQAIFDTCYDMLAVEKDLLEKTVNPTDLARQVIETSKLVIKELTKQAKKVKTKEDLLKIAYVALEDRKLAEKVAEAMHKIGKRGFVVVEEGFGYETDFRVVDGMRLSNASFVRELAPYLITNPKREAIMKDPMIFVTNKEIDSVEFIQKFCDVLIKQHNISQLVIMSPQFTPAVYQFIVVNRLKKIFNILPIRIGSETTEEIEDISFFTGGFFHDTRQGFKTDKVPPLDTLGKAKKIIATKDEVIIVEGKGNKKEIAQRLKELEEQEEKGERSDVLKKIVERRIGSLAGGVAKIEVAAKSDAQKAYLKEKVDDAVHAVRAAQEEGYVKGGGLALKEIAEQMDESVLTKALKEPHKRIQDNGKVEITDDIIDPVKVVRTALENAVSLASMLISSEIIVVWKRGGFEEALGEMMKNTWADEQADKERTYQR